MPGVKGREDFDLKPTVQTHIYSVFDRNACILYAEVIEYNMGIFVLLQSLYVPMGSCGYTCL